MYDFIWNSHGVFWALFNPNIDLKPNDNVGRPACILNGFLYQESCKLSHAIFE